ncbi:MAG TPA: LAGLIDADG family homing endonuclease [Solirubrobacteraceae bacterium]|nr:LAGLIDADG family homing endonuclease [Solirubrobacteraceae bacterium]
MDAPQTALMYEGQAGQALTVRRRFTTPGVHPFDSVEWELRDARIGHGDRVAFEQTGVEFPVTWSQNATNIVAQKYFRGQLGSPARERSVKQMISRVAGTIADWGRQRGYFATPDDGDTFEAELTYVLLHQMAAFNSPVWFNVGFEEQPQCSACLPYGALVSTPEGMVPIGQLVEDDVVGREVYDSHGTTRIVATKANGIKPAFRVRLRNGSFVEATADHVVKAVRERRTQPQWLRVGELELGMRMHLHPHRAKVAAPALVPAGPGDAAVDEVAETAAATDPVKVSEAALAGWLQADGFVGQYAEGTNRSLTIEFQVANEEERAWVEDHLDVALPDVHRKVRDADTLSQSVQRIRLYGEVLRPFVERFDLLDRRTEIRVPWRLWTASHEEIAAYLRSIFQADGYVTVRRDRGCENAKVGFAVIGERWTEDVQILLGVLGIYSRRSHKADKRANRHDLHEVFISIGSERARFAEFVGFVDARKQRKLLASLELRNPKRCPHLREEEIVAIQPLGEMEVYDIQTESGEFLTNNIAVHNCFILSVDDTMESILDWNTKEGKIFRGGSGSGINLSNIRGSREPLSKGGTASGPVSFMRGADSWAGTIKSGGKTRRAAKMVVLDIDHPDIRDFIWCKAREEKKANALRDAGFDMSIDGEGFTSIQYQNANNSVRVSEAFMRAVENDEEWQTIARTTGEPIGDPIPARELMRDIAEAAWQCADPGVQYDTTINQWHTCPNSGRINASNPCFPADARVHTTKGLMPIGDLIARGEAGEEIRVYTHRATARTPARGVVATEPVAFMRNGVKPIVRLRFADGGEMRCTPNHRVWTLNRGYVRAEELTAQDRVLLNDSATPATDASWTLPVRVEALAKSFSRGSAVTHQRLPERWSEGLAELTGHLIGDGCLTDARAEWIYGGDDLADGMADSHEGLLRELVGGVSRQEMSNGCVQLRAGSTAVRAFFRELGVTSARAHDKRVPTAVLCAPVQMQAAFLRGLFGADGCVSRVESGGKASRYAGLGSRSEALLKDVQRMLNAFGVRGRIFRVTESKKATFSYRRTDGTSVEYASREGFDLRITGSDLERFAEAVGFSAPRKQAALQAMLAETGRYRTKRWTTLLSREEDGQEEVFNLTEPLHHSYIVDGVVVANCSEYMHVDDSACNLASLNLMKFRREDGSFDVECFKHTVDIVFLAQEIVVGPSSYPTEEIAVNARAFRQLGLGYANLGAFLMANGMPYDSDEGRGTAAAITALLTGRAYLGSARVAAALGPYERYGENREAHNAVMRMHRDSSYAIPDATCADTGLLSAARASWDDAVAVGEHFGYRNAQATVLAPTGTISFLLDCDTTGVEPDFSLVKFKELVGGGQMTIANRTVPMALRTLGYAEEQIGPIEAHIEQHGTIVGAPGLADEHLEVFDVAVGQRAISHMGHIKMMGAVQPFISGASSKTVNLPQTATVEDIADAYLEAWRCGVKALAIYRDGSKTAQALRTDAQDAKEADAAVAEGLFTQEQVDDLVATAIAAARAEAQDRGRKEAGPARKRMPRERQSITHKFSIGGHEGYITAGMYEDGSLGEIFLTDIGKEGSTLRGLLNSFATAISIALQYGVPLETLVSKFCYMRFEPEGITQNPEIPFAKSMPDYIMRWLASRFLDTDAQEELGILTPEVRARKAAEDAASSMVASDTAGPANGGPGAATSTKEGVTAKPPPGPAPTAPGHGERHGPMGTVAGSEPATTRAAAEALTDTPPVVPARLVGLDLGPACNQCGGMMQRTGSCYTCSSCGNNTGCG